MKRSLVAVAVIILSAAAVYAGPCVQYLTPPQNSGVICLDTSGNMNFIDAASSQTLVFMGPAQRTLSQLQTSSPGFLYQQFVCTTCTQTPVCVATGTALGQIAAVSVSSGATTGFGACR